MFPFNATQQPAPLGLQIAQAPDSLAIPNPVSASFDASEPLANQPFLANMPPRAAGDSAPNPAQTAPAPTAMLQQVSAAAATSSQPPNLSSVPPRQPSPPHVHQPSSRDFFGELEKALALGGSAAQGSPEETFDVLDDALALGSNSSAAQPQQPAMPAPVVSSQPQQPPLQPWPNTQHANTGIQQSAQLQQSQLQNQLEQQQQQQQLRQRQLQHHAQIAQQHLLQQQLQQQHLHQQQIRDQHMQQRQMQHQQLRHQQSQLQQLAQLQPQTQGRGLHHSTQLPDQRKSNTQQSPSQTQQPAQSVQVSQPSQRVVQQHIQPATIQPAVPPNASPVPVNVTYPTQSFAGGNGTELVAVTSSGSHSGDPSSQSGKSKSKSGRKQSQRRPRSRSQQKNLQPKNIQAASPPNTLSHGPQHVHMSHMLAPHMHGTPRQHVQGQSPQQAYVSPSQAMSQSPPLPLQQSPSQLSQVHQQELQSRIIQQQLHARQQQSSHGQTPIVGMGANNFIQSGYGQSGNRISAHGQPESSVPLGSSQRFEAQSGLQNRDFVGGAQLDHIAQRAPSGLTSVGKYDAVALQNVLSKTNDPKVYAVLRQQVEMLRGNGISGQLSQSRPGHVAPQQQSGRGGPPSTLLPAGQGHPHAIPQQQAMANSQSTSQAVLFHHQQLAQKQQMFKQHQQQQPQQQIRPAQRPISVDQTRNVAGIFPRSNTYQHPPRQNHAMLNPHAGQSMASLPQHVQHQIQAQIQARHIQAQLRGQSHLPAQRNPNHSAALQNVTSVLPQRSAPVETRKPRRSPKPSKPPTEPAQINGTLPGPSLGAHGAPLPASLHAAGAGQYQPRLQPQPGSQAAGGRPAKRRTPGRSLGLDGSVGASGTPSSSAHARKPVDAKKLAAERKRLAREAELREIAAQKRQRLNLAPTNDFRNALSPDYVTPFSGHVNAWLRLVPFHVFLSNEKDSVSQDDWNSHVDKLAARYHEWFGKIKKNRLAMMDQEVEIVHKETSKCIASGLDNDDCAVMEQVLLDDFYETARKEAAVAQQRAVEASRQRATEIQAQGSSEQNVGGGFYGSRENVGSSASDSARQQTPYGDAAINTASLHNRQAPAHSPPPSYPGIAHAGATQHVGLQRLPAQQVAAAKPPAVYGRSAELQPSLAGTPAGQGRGGLVGARFDVLRTSSGPGPRTVGIAPMQRSPPTLTQLPSVQSAGLPQGGDIVSRNQSQAVSRSQQRFGQHRPPPAMQQSMLARGSALMMPPDRAASSSPTGVPTDSFEPNSLLQTPSRSGPSTDVVNSGASRDNRKGNVAPVAISRPPSGAPAGHLVHSNVMSSTIPANHLSKVLANGPGGRINPVSSGQEKGESGHSLPIASGITASIQPQTVARGAVPSRALPSMKAMGQLAVQAGADLQPGSVNAPRTVEPARSMVQVHQASTSGSRPRSSRGSRSEAGLMQGVSAGIQHNEQRDFGVEPSAGVTLHPQKTKSGLGKLPLASERQDALTGRSGTVQEGAGKSGKEKGAMGMGSLLNADGS